MNPEHSLTALVESYNPWWGDRSATTTTPFLARRETAFQELLRGATDPSSLSVVLRGPRRCGKTVLLSQLIHVLLTERKIPPHRLCYFDLSDAAATSTDRSSAVLDLVLAAWPAAGEKQPMLLVLDELQAIEGWERWLKTLIDRTEIRVIATGSSSHSLVEGGRESGRGRWVEREIEFLTLPETLTLKYGGIDARATLGNHPGEFERFLRVGGFPELLHGHGSEAEVRRFTRSECERDILSELSDDLRKPSGAVRVFQQIALASGDALTLNKVGDALGLDPKTVASMLKSLEDMLLVRSLEPTQFTATGGPRAQRKRLEKPKVYASEHGHVSAFARSNRPLDDADCASRIFETAVYRALRSVRSTWDVREIGYARVSGGHEVDFVVVGDERTVGVEVTAGGWRQDKHAKATAAAGAFRVPGVIVGGSAAPPTAQGLPWVTLRDFLLDPVTSLEAARKA